MSRRLAGYAAMAVTVFLWAGFALSTRAISLSHLTTVDVAVLRYGIPVVVLAPRIPTAFRELRAANVTACLSIVVGAGLPYFFLTSTGGALSSASFVGVIVPGSAPIFVIGVEAVLMRRMVSRRTLVAAAAIAVGVASLAAAAPRGIRPAAVLILVAAGALWALYTIGLRRAGLRPSTAILLLCVPSFGASVLLLAAGAAPSHLFSSTWSTIVPFALVQGGGVGVVAGLAYAFAIRTIGSGTSATVGALSPAITTILALPLFGETVTLPIVIAIAVIIAGVVAVNAFPSPATKEAYVLHSSSPAR